MDSGGPNEALLDGAPDPPCKAAILRGKEAAYGKMWGLSAVSYARTSEVIESWVNPGNHVLHGGADAPAEKGTFRGASGPLQSIGFWSLVKG